VEELKKDFARARPKIFLQWGCTTGNAATVAHSSKKKKKAEKIL
jgi:hypothetical protein